MLEHVTNRGIDFISALQEINSSLIIRLKSDGSIEEDVTHDWGTGFTLSHGSINAFHSSNQLDAVGSELIELSDKLLSFQNTKAERSPNIEEKNIIKKRLDLTLERDRFINRSDFYFELIKDIKSLFSSHINVPYSVNIENSLLTRCFQSSDLLDITHKYDRTLISINLFVKGRNIVLREILGGIERASYSWENIEKKINEVITRAEQLPQSKGFNPGKCDAVLSPDSTYSLIHETIGHGAEADQIVNKNSFLTNLTGYPVASELLTVIDDPHIRNFGWAEFDDEGTKTQGTLILEDGILNQFLHSKITAEILNSHSTGNARASSYLSPPAPRQSNIYIEPRDHSFEELLEEVKNGVFIGTTESASTSIFTGDFIVNSQYGYEINNGELGKLLLPIKYSGSSLAVLQNITSIGNEVDTIPTLCLKEESRVYMGAIAPAMSISNLNIY